MVCNVISCVVIELLMVFHWPECLFGTIVARKNQILVKNFMKIHRFFSKISIIFANYSSHEAQIVSGMVAIDSAHNFTIEWWSLDHFLAKMEPEKDYSDARPRFRRPLPWKRLAHRHFGIFSKNFFITCSDNIFGTQKNCTEGMPSKFGIFDPV